MRAGQLVVATPQLGDPNFARTVVLLLQVNDDGALGVVLNRPTETEVAEVLPLWAPLAAAPPTVFAGGPVQPQAAICLGRGRPGYLTVPGFAQVDGLPDGALGTIDLDGSPDDLHRAVSEVRLFAGYAGWSAGQLEAEIGEGAWWVLDALPADAFAVQPELLWRQVLLRQGPPIAFAASYPADPKLN
ncbi:MAG: YqgE/AlgH family protein [Actinobacteria bacterium]|nr:YqgE/AlgH family protein [Actinomycetota bacterium]MBW3646339.1 YqgE/AlgH family protein [Actinomycetota bacterium]